MLAHPHQPDTFSSHCLASLLSSNKMSALLPFTSTPFSQIPKCLRPKTITHHFLPKLPPKCLHSSYSSNRSVSPLTPKASVDSVDYVVEPATNVRFPKELTVPGCPESLVLLGTGYREKVFAIIGVKVYASGFYAKYSIREVVESWKGKSADEVLEDSSLFSSILHAPLEKSLKIMLVRDVDGKTFWNALNDAISPRIKEPTAVDESALSTFRNTFQGRDLKQGTLIFLTWIEPSKMLVSISSDGFPTNVDAEIESVNVTLSLFDAFFGESPVSPTLKSSVANGLVALLN